MDTDGSWSWTGRDGGRFAQCSRPGRGRGLAIARDTALAKAWTFRVCGAASARTPNPYPAKGSRVPCVFSGSVRRLMQLTLVLSPPTA